jgi:hypothetical protein
MVRPISAIVSRSTLRDVMNRLRKIKKACGRDDEEGGETQSTGDPFRDKILQFQKSAKDVNEMITERNSEARKNQLAPAEIAQKSHDINVEMRNLTADLRAIEALAEAAIRDVARTNIKIKKAGEKNSDERKQKLEARERIAKEREKAVTSCRQVVEDLKELNQQRFMTEKEVKAAKDQAAIGGGKGGKGGVQLRQTLQQRLKQQARRKAGGGDDAEGEMPSKRLEDDPETAQQAKQLVEMKKKEDMALDRIKGGIDRITDIAIQIGQELDAQDKMLQEAEDKADKATKDLKTINRGLSKLLKEQKPMNMIINVACFLLILGLVGFFLSEGGVI